jgi:hypothetical protein
LHDAVGVWCGDAGWWELGSFFFYGDKVTRGPSSVKLAEQARVSDTRQTLEVMSEYRWHYEEKNWREVLTL